MTGAEGMVALAAKVEAATYADKALNRVVARAVGWGYQTPSEARRKNPAWFHPDDCRHGVPVIDSLHGTDVWREPLDYLGSLDAAMTLVPEGAMDHAEIYRPDHQTLGWTVYLHSNANLHRPSYQGFAASFPLALTAAALRARAGVL